MVCIHLDGFESVKVDSEEQSRKKKYSALPTPWQTIDHPKVFQIHVICTNSVPWVYILANPSFDVHSINVNAREYQGSRLSKAETRFGQESKTEQLEQHFKKTAK